MDFRTLPHIDSLSFQGISFKHEGQDATLVNADFDFNQGAYWLKSSEGAGKSTVLQILAGLLLPSSGSYLMNGLDVTAMSFEEFLPYRLRVGFTFDYGGLISNQTIQDNLLLPLLYHRLVPEDDARARVDKMIQRFDMEKYRKERPAHVPGRVRKLAVILRGLITYPQVLLLDDPSVGLGEATAQNFAELITELQAKKVLRYVIASSYDDKFMSLLPHDILHLDQGLLYHQPAEQSKKAVNA